MRIEHAAMYVKDIERAKWFFEYYFGAKAGDRYENTATGFSSYFLSFDDGARLEIMNKPGLADNGSNASSYGFVHLAFSVGSREKVDELTRRLKDASYEVISGPRVTGDGYYESCIAAIEGNLLEITE